MDLKGFDGKCVRITTCAGEIFEGVVSYDSREYAVQEYGHDQEALHMTPIVFYRDEMASVTSLEDVNGPCGHYSERYGLLEEKCLEWGTDLIEEVFDSEDDTQILRMLACMKDHLPSLAARAVPGMASWRGGKGTSEAEAGESEQGPVYMGELEHMLGTLVKHSANANVVREAGALLDGLAAHVS